MNNNNNTMKSTNCENFFNDFTKCVNDRTSVLGKLKKPNVEPINSNYFNFFNCGEYDNFINSSRLKIKEISFNPNDISYPYNSYYSITNNNGKIKIKFYE